MGRRVLYKALSTYFVTYSSTTTPLSSTVVITSPLELKSTALNCTAFTSPPAFVDGFLIEVRNPPSTSGTLVQILPNELLKVVCAVIANAGNNTRLRPAALLLMCTSALSNATHSCCKCEFEIWLQEFYLVARILSPIRLIFACQFVDAEQLQIL